MKKLNFIWSVVVVITMAVFMVSLAQNMLLRSSGPYLFYFNDSRAVNKAYTTLSAAEMADGISGFMGSWNPKEFQIYEDTGYDERGIFTDEEGLNMLKVKKTLDLSAWLGVVSFIITAAIYTYFLRDGKKKVLRDRYWISLGLTMAWVTFQSFLTATNGGRKWIAGFLDIKLLDKDSYLNILLGGDFIAMATTFFIVISLIIMGIVTYACLQLTKPPRIFF